MSRVMALTCSLVTLSTMTTSVMAQPAIWESNYGSSLFLSGSDDDAEMVSLSFAFSYGGVTTNNLYVGTNGGIGVGGIGEADDYPSGDEFLFTSDPMLAVFWSDLDLSDIGEVYFNDFGNRAVITWDGVGSYQNANIPFTFQAQVFDNGTIIFGYNGIPEINDSNLDTNVHVGLTPGNLTDWPSTVDYSSAPFHVAGQTILELWEYDAGVAFDLDMMNVIFRPDGLGGYTVTVPVPATTALLGIIGLAGRRRR
ncbi:MAG: hypothetical protein Kow0022_12270 [Phycisphaerales bacterium]